MYFIHTETMDNNVYAETSSDIGLSLVSGKVPVCWIFMNINSKDSCLD